MLADAWQVQIWLDRCEDCGFQDASGWIDTDDGNFYCAQCWYAVLVMSNYRLINSKEAASFHLQVPIVLRRTVYDTLVPRSFRLPCTHLHVVSWM